MYGPLALSLSQSHTQPARVRVPCAPIRNVILKPGMSVWPHMQLHIEQGKTVWSLFQSSSWLRLRWRHRPSTFVDGRKSKKRTGSFPAMASKALWPSFAQLSVAHHHLFQIILLLYYIASMLRHRQPANQPLCCLY